MRAGFLEQQPESCVIENRHQRVLMAAAAGLFHQPREERQALAHAPSQLAFPVESRSLEFSMKHITLALVLLLLACVAVAVPQTAQTPGSRTAAEIVRRQIANTEKELTGVASEMPDDKYEFAPTQGAFRGVRNFAKQVKHAAAVNHLVAATILGERITADMSDERG